MRYMARFRSSDLQIQPLEYHINHVAEIAKIFAKKAYLTKTMELAGYLHDMGKYADEFQEYILSEYERAQKDKEDYLRQRHSSDFDHGVYGAKYIYERFHKGSQEQKITSEILALAVAYHHGRLPDCEDENGNIPVIQRIGKVSGEQLQKILKIFYREIIEEAELEKLFHQSCEELKTVFEKNVDKIDGKFKGNLIVKLVYSMLIDADRLDAMCFELGEPWENYVRKFEIIDDKWKQYQTQFEAYIEYLGKSCEKIEEEKTKKINKIRQRISDECLSSASMDTGIYRLNVPTGGGKTYSSMRFALEHCRKHQKERIIYVIPYTSIIEQNADVIRKSLGNACDILEHHSNVIDDYKPEVSGVHKEYWDSKEDFYRLCTERWDNDIIFTTMVQFLQTFYGKSTQDMRRMHHLVNATIIFDEVQTVPVKCMYLFNSAINFLCYLGNTTIVLSTATQLNMNKMKHPIFFEEKKKEIIEDMKQDFAVLKRTEIKDCTERKTYSIDEMEAFIMNKKSTVKSLLVVVNKVKTANELYERLAEKTDTKLILLTSRFCPKNKREILKDINDALEKKEDIICISTSIIEAGVDISFEAAIRNITKLDSIIQTAGRVNRNGEKELGYCYVVNAEEGGYEHMQEVKIGGKYSRDIFDLFDADEIDTEEAISQYFSDYFENTDIKKELPYPLKHKRQNIYKLLCSVDSNVRESNVRNKEEKTELYIHFKEAADHFQVIEENTRTVIVPYEEGLQIMEKIDQVNAFTTAKEKRELLQEAKEYAVNIYEYQLKKLEAEGAIQKNEYLGVWMLSSGYYDEKRGVLDEPEMECFIS